LGTNNITTEIRPILDTDHSAILDLVADLPEWFDADARTRGIPIDLNHQQGFVAKEGGKIVGFITIFVAEGRLNIGWLGVKKDCQRKGVGGRLLDAAEETARDMGLCELATYTLGDAWIMCHMNKPEISTLSMASQSTKRAKQIIRVAPRKSRLQSGLPNLSVQVTARAKPIYKVIAKIE
jgi:GNAT superfamily N-acetyltransferase